MKAHLKRHQDNLHSAQNQWNCDLCGKRYAFKRLLSIHMTSHLVTDFKCTECNKMFQRAANLVNHMKLHSGVSTEICAHCNEGFSTKHQLKQHVVTNHFTDRMLCDFCDSQFIRKHHYKRHLLTIHKTLSKKDLNDTVKKIENIRVDYNTLKFINA